MTAMAEEHTSSTRCTHATTTSRTLTRSIMARLGRLRRAGTLVTRAKHYRPWSATAVSTFREPRLAQSGIWRMSKRVGRRIRCYRPRWSDSTRLEPRRSPRSSAKEASSPNQSRSSSSNTCSKSSAAPTRWCSTRLPGRALRRTQSWNKTRQTAATGGSFWSNVKITPTVSLPNESVASSTASRTPRTRICATASADHSHTTPSAIRSSSRRCSAARLCRTTRRWRPTCSTPHPASRPAPTRWSS